MKVFRLPKIVMLSKKKKTIHFFSDYIHHLVSSSSFYFCIEKYFKFLYTKNVGKKRKKKVLSMEIRKHTETQKRRGSI